MASVTSASMRTEGGELVIEFELDGVPDEWSLTVQVSLGQHDDISGEEAAVFSCELEDGRYLGRVALQSDSADRLLELAWVQRPDESRIELPRRFLFLEPHQADGEWDSGDKASARLNELAQAQGRRYSLQLLAGAASISDPKFAVLVIGDNLLLTRWQRVPGIAAIPITEAGYGSDEVALLNHILLQTGFKGAVDPAWWINSTSRIRPSFLVLLPEVHAANAESAARAARDVTLSFLDLLALRRGAAPRLLGGVVGGYDGDDATVRHSWIEGAYSGNHLGGFISGEDQHGLLEHWAGVLKNPKAKLWLSLYEDALRETRWDFRFFRLFSMLESIGGDILPPNDVILDDNSQPRMKDATDAHTTASPRGKIYELTKKARAALGAQFVGDQFWETISPWAPVRNQVAHEGGWALPEGEQPDKERRRIERKVTKLGHDGTFESGVDAMLREIRDVAVEILISALKGKL